MGKFPWPDSSNVFYFSKSAVEKNQQIEFDRNKERFQFLKVKTVDV